MYCPNCGSEIKENSTFCTNCGKAVSTTECRSAEHDYNHAAEPTGASAGYPVPPTQSANGDCMEPMTVKDYIGMMLLMLIPVANIVLLFVWAFGGPTNRNKRNYCRAALLLAAIVLAIYAVIAVIVVLFAVGVAGSLAGGLAGAYYS